MAENTNRGRKPNDANKQENASTKIEKKLEVADIAEAIDDVKLVVKDECATTDVTDIGSSEVAGISEAINLLSDNSDNSIKTESEKYKLTDKVACKSIFHGKLIYTSPTNGARYIWESHGSVRHLPISELETMNNSKPDMLNKPYILVLNEDVANDYCLGETYSKVASIKKLDQLFATGNVELIRKKVNDLIDVGMRETLISDIRTRRMKNTLVDINIINMLKAELKFNIE